MSVQGKIVLLGCDHSAGEAVRGLGELGLSLPKEFLFVGLPCGSTLDELYILRAFEAGAERVVVFSCCQGACRSLDGARWAERRVAAARALLDEAGVGGWRLDYRTIAPNQARDLWYAVQHLPEPPAAPSVDSAQPATASEA